MGATTSVRTALTNGEIAIVKNVRNAVDMLTGGTKNMRTSATAENPSSENHDQSICLGMSYWGIPMPKDLESVIRKMADKEDRMREQVLLDLVRKGLECGRMHKSSREVIRRNK